VPTLEETTQKVLQFLAENLIEASSASSTPYGHPYIDPSLGEDGGYFVDKGSTTCVISFQQWPPGEVGHVLVSLRSPVLFNVPITDELCRWIATNGERMFCHYALAPDESGKLGSLWLRHHVLLGDTIDAGQVFHALVFCLTSADDEDEALQEYFGGNRLRELAHSPRDGRQWSDHGDDHGDDGSNSGYIAYGGGDYYDDGDDGDDDGGDD
jgi:hypothetical protein